MAEEIGNAGAVPETYTPTRCTGAVATDPLICTGDGTGKLDPPVPTTDKVETKGRKGGEEDATKPPAVGGGDDGNGGDGTEKVTLTSRDNREFVVDARDASQSLLIKRCLEDGYTAVPLPNVDGDSLAKVIEHWKAHSDTAEKGIHQLTNDERLKLQAFDRGFVESLGQDRLLEMVMVTNYLESKTLFELLCQATAHHIKDMTVEQAREFFQVENDFTPAEEAAARNEYPWVFE